MEKRERSPNSAPDGQIYLHQKRRVFTEKNAMNAKIRSVQYMPLNLNKLTVS
jgi:hypothetical protein